MKELSIKISNISKSYDDVTAIKDISFNVKKGELFGLIGPDGAGKTTLIRILTTLLLSDTGKANVESLDVVKNLKKIRQIIGYMPGRFSLYQDLTVEENLNFFATIFGTTIEENYELVKDIYSHIEPFKARKAGDLSGGMKQKLALSCALIHKPKVLFLDEPTTGVDAVSRKEFWDMLKKLQKKDITILVSTPYMDEASLCDRVALMQKGEIMSIDTPENITNQFEKILFSIKADNKFKLIKDLRDYEYQNSVNAFGQFIHYTDKSENRKIDDIKYYLKEKKHTNIEVKIIQANIEDCFIELMKE
ncbi:MAG: ABC transporter ATP-binding protein [Bacteroidales bacterium]|nr:ABC transporter ATP-binding protein [Bacteroidales bacterium]